MERPILFSGPMVRAILEGRKTQTRRVLKPQLIPYGNTFGWPLPKSKGGGICTSGGPVSGGMQGLACHCPYGNLGDRLWVRETFSYEENGPRIWYWADGNIAAFNCERPRPIKPSIHMPRWASRITLEITGVRVERLQDISYDDAIAEGCEQRTTCINPGKGVYSHVNEPQDDFSRLWKSINGAESWDANPWVWVIEFKRVEA